MWNGIRRMKNLDKETLKNCFLGNDGIKLENMVEKQKE